MIEAQIQAAAAAARIEVLRREEGKGGLIRVPIARSTKIENPDAMAYASDAFNLDAFVWDQVVRNFGKKGGPPPPVYFGHVTPEARATEPAAGFIERVFRNGELLWGDLAINEDTWEKVVAKQGFRGFSVELDYNLKTPTSTIPGWMLTGGAITNDPALDVHFVSATASETKADARVTLNTPAESVVLADGPTKEEPSMADSTQSTDQLAALSARVAELEAAKTADSERIAQLEAELEQQTKSAEEARAQLTANEIRQEVVAALAEGKMTPAQTDGYDADPVAWLTASPFNGVRGLRLFLSTAPVQKKIGASTVSTGRPAAQIDPRDAFQNAVAAEMANGKNYKAALEAVRATNPTLYAAIAASYRAEMKEV